MADRRMISKKIIESARFLKMPAAAQSLYCHLIVNADDDGIVESYPVMCMLRADEDALRILEDRKFIRLLNEDYVAYICDWTEQNHIRPDRKTDSIYQHLLKEMIPEAPILAKKRRSDLKGQKESDGEDGPSMDGPRAAEVSKGQDSSDQNSTGEESRIKCSLGNETLTQEQYDALVQEYGADNADEVIRRILEHPYYKCLNPAVIGRWCRENHSRRTAKKGSNSFNNFEHHDYSPEFFSELDSALQAI